MINKSYNSTKFKISRLILLNREQRNNNTTQNLQGANENQDKMSKIKERYMTEHWFNTLQTYKILKNTHPRSPMDPGKGPAAFWAAC